MGGQDTTTTGTGQCTNCQCSEPTTHATLLMQSTPVRENFPRPKSESWDLILLSRCKRQDLSLKSDLEFTCLLQGLVEFCRSQQSARRFHCCSLASCCGLWSRSTRLLLVAESATEEELLGLCTFSYYCTGDLSSQ